ncbi:sugar transporter [Meira miltonrushii]|uniref:Sugar transporter n=1 Tax=Meira miltonrushii TaxID=1280837 RepID=A0A316VLV4_9BASI|nr:sugar transporter [Meira miltonrushii]PWN38609.1 sugar transporter [Meira miltonrushii]
MASNLHVLEDSHHQTARIDAYKVAQQLDNYDVVVDAAAKATKTDHEMTLWQALKRNKKAVLWSMLLSTALVMEGYDLVIINSFYGQEQFRQHYGKFDEANQKWYIPASWQSGLTNGALCGQIVGLLINSWASQRFGYRRTMATALAFMACAIFPVFFAPNLPVLVLGEILCGLPWGIFQTITTAYAADILPIALRPLLTSYVNMCWGFGILMSSGVARAALDLEGAKAYHVPFALQWIWPLPLFIGVCFAPESPWWLIRKGRVDDAEHSIRRLNSSSTSEEEVQDTLAMMQHTDAIEKAENEGVNILDCFRGTNLRRTEIGCAVFAIQYLAGGPLIGYAVTFLQQAGMDDESAFDFNLGVTTMFTVGTIVSWFFLNKVGRRTIYIGGIALMSFISLIIGILGFIPNTSLAVGVLLICLNFAYNIGIGPVCYCIVAEVSSSRLRPIAVVLSRISYNLMGLVCNTITPRMIQPTSWGWGARCGLFWMGTGIAACTYCYFRLVETRGRTFAELDALFAAKIPARKFATTDIDLFTHTQDVKNATPTNGKQGSNGESDSVDDKKF